MADERVTLKFQVGMSPYQAGETASFSVSEAKIILTRKLATVVDGHHRLGLETPEVEQAEAEAEVETEEQDTTLIIDYDELIRAELMKIAGERGLEYSTRATKADLVELLRSDDNERAG